ncbi:hypothetical protein GCM10010413_06150 [Promicromonospora sukumoe]
MTTAQTRLLATLDNAAQVTPQGSPVWGQFVDVPARSRQFGIYGTCAALSVLARHDRDTRPTLRVLPQIEPESATHPRFDASDLLLTFKVTAIVEALGVSKLSDAKDQPIVRTLVDGLVDDQGWGDHLVSSEPEPPRVLATSQALIALVPFCGGGPARRFDGPVAWLQGELSNNSGLDTIEIAFGCLALARMRDAGLGLDDTDSVIRQTTRSLAPWLRGRWSTPLEYVQYHYYVPAPDDARNHQVSFPLQIIVALALLTSGSWRPARHAVHGIAGDLFDTVERNGGTRSTASKRQPMVDINWVDQLLEIYLRQQALRPVSWRLTGILRRMRWLSRLAVLALLLAVTVVATVIAVDPGISALTTAVVTTVVAISSGIATSVIQVWLRFKD